MFQINGTNKMYFPTLDYEWFELIKISFLRADEFIKFDEFDEKWPAHT